MKTPYHNQVALLLDVLPHVEPEDCFGLKGGTAINLFLRDMPRLSVDIDLHYLPIDPRDEAIAATAAALSRIADRVRAAIPSATVSTFNAGKLAIQGNDATVKVEVSPVTRGHLYPVQELDLCESGQDTFERFAVARVVSVAEVWAGKLIAALDRQHPRDLFDTRYILEQLDQTGIRVELRRSLMAMLLSSSRPPHELLSPNEHDRTHQYEQQFLGMTRDRFTLSDHRQVFGSLMQRLGLLFGPAERAALMAAVSGDSDFANLAGEDVAALPAVRWKLQNLQRMRAANPDRATEHVELLERVFSAMDR